MCIRLIPGCLFNYEIRSTDKYDLSLSVIYFWGILTYTLGNLRAKGGLRLRENKENTDVCEESGGSAGSMSRGVSHSWQFS